MQLRIIIKYLGRPHGYSYFASWKHLSGLATNTGQSRIIIRPLRLRTERKHLSRGPCPCCDNMTGNDQPTLTWLLVFETNPPCLANLPRSGLCLKSGIRGPSLIFKKGLATWDMNRGCSLLRRRLSLQSQDANKKKKKKWMWMADKRAE